MIYADYAYYRDRYMGVLLSEEDYDAMALRASRYLDYYTKGGAEKNAGLEGVKMACCALAEQYKVISDAQRLASGSMDYALKNDGEVTSENVGGYSVSRKSGGSGAMSAMEACREAERALPFIAFQYLADTGLLYRGGCR